MNYKIAVLPGDGIGPEVTDQAVRVLKTIGEKFGHIFELETALVGGIAIDETGSALPEITLEVAKKADSIFKLQLKDMLDGIKAAEEFKPKPNLRAGKYFYRMLAASIIETEQWDKVDQISPPEGWKPKKYSEAGYNFVQGFADAMQGKPQANEYVSKLSAFRNKKFNKNYFVRYENVEVWELEIKAAIKLHQKDYASAIKLAKQATLIEAKLPTPSGPPRILKPTYELLGEVYLKANEPLKAKENFASNNLDENKISWGDIEDPMTYNHLLDDGKYDALLAMGVMPHVRDIQSVLQNMKSMVSPGGKFFIEFRNKLFSLFTFNRYTHEFILNDLLADVSPELKALVAKDLEGRLEMDKPTPRLKASSAGTNEEFVGYDAILSEFHNPFEVRDLFTKLGFIDIKFIWYHYHPAMPFLTAENADLFRSEALNLEYESSGWRGLFLCSAFVIEASNPSE